MIPTNQSRQSSEKHETMPNDQRPPPSLSPSPTLLSLPTSSLPPLPRKERKREGKKKVNKHTSGKSVREDPSVPGEEPRVKRIAVPGRLMRMRRRMGPARRTAMGIRAVWWAVGRRAMMRLEGHR